MNSRVVSHSTIWSAQSFSCSEQGRSGIMRYSKQKGLYLRACTEKSTAQYVRPSATHPTAPPRFSSIDHGHQPKKRYLETDETRSNKAGMRAKQDSVPLGDWNAGKEEDSLPGPNFDVPRDLFKGATRVKRRQVVHSLCNTLSRHGVNTRDRRPWHPGRTIMLAQGYTVCLKGLIIPSCRPPAGESKMLAWVLLATCSHPTP